MNDIDKKITRTDIITSGILITLIVSKTVYGDIKLPISNPFILYFIAMFYLAVYVLAHHIWLSIVQNIGNNLEFKNKLALKILTISAYFSVVAFMWVYPSSGLFEALFFKLNHLNWFQVGIVVFISYVMTKNSDINNIFTPFIWATAVIHLLTLYLSYGVNDGCTTYGSDPLFGGGGYVECEADFKNAADQAKEIASKNSFNQTSLFAVDFIFLCFISYLSIVASYLKNKIF